MTNYYAARYFQVQNLFWSQQDLCYIVIEDNWTRPVLRSKYVQFFWYQTQVTTMYNASRIADNSFFQRVVEEDNGWLLEEHFARSSRARICLELWVLVLLLLLFLLAVRAGGALLREKWPQKSFLLTPEMTREEAGVCGACAAADHHTESYPMTNFWVQSTFVSMFFIYQTKS